MDATDASETLLEQFVFCRKKFLSFFPDVKNDLETYFGYKFFPADTFTIDRAGLDRLQSDLLTNTEGHTLVMLQKLNCKLWEVVTKYKQKLDRTQLVPDMSNVCQEIIATNTSSPPTSPNSSINKKRKLTVKD